MNAKRRGRPKKKTPDPQRSMEELMNRAVSLFKVPFDDRDGVRPAGLPSLNAVAESMNTTALRVRKLLITAEAYTTEASRRVRELLSRGDSLAAVMEKTGLGRASVYSYVPYKGLAFNLAETTVNADRHRAFRRRARALEELKAHMGLPDECLCLWKAVIAFENYPFTTSGRGSRPGVRFTCSVSRCAVAGGRHYEGESMAGYGNELWIVTSDGGKKRSISRSTVELGYRRAVEAAGAVNGSKALGIPGAGSYLYPILIRFGLIRPSWPSGS